MDSSPDWRIIVQGEVCSALIVVGRSRRNLPLQHVELLTKCQDLSLQRCPRPEQSEQCAPEQATDIPHRAAASPDSTSFASGPSFRQGQGPGLSLDQVRLITHPGEVDPENESLIGSYALDEFFKEKFEIMTRWCDWLDRLEQNKLVIR